MSKININIIVFMALVFTWLLVISGSNAMAQTTTKSPVSENNLIPPSPTAASLGKYAEWPVSYYTGTPQVNIPLHTLAAKGISVPVTLDYHASGIKVDEYASWVGLGWSLNAGGVITRSVRGKPDDEGGQGYLFSRSMIGDPGNGLNSNANWNILHQEAMGVIDTQPDIYMFNALGRSFQFLIDSNYNVQSVPRNAVKIMHATSLVGAGSFGNNDQWIAQLEDGTRLYFGGTGAIERNETRTAYNSDNYFYGSGFVSSWFLKKIVPPNGPEINFNYVVEYSSMTNLQSTTDYQKLGVSPNKGFENNTSQTNIYGVRLSSIQAADQLVKFIPHGSGRTDITGSYALDSIKVYSLPGNKLIKQFGFNYSYAGGGSGRLHLDGVTQYDVAGAAHINSWSFAYDPQTLPARGSFSQDHWGYYNGTNNATLLPPIEGYTGTLASGDRETHFPYSQAETLTQINYPTGGYSKFYYDPNSYTDIATDGVIKADTTILEASDPMNTIKTSSFTKNSYHYAALRFFFIKDPNENDPLYVSVKIKRDGEVLYTKYISVNGDSEDQLYLGPGHYTMEVVSPDMTNTYCSAIISWQEMVTPYTTTRIVGGLRVKQIEDFDGMSTVNKRTFTYTDAYCASPIKNENYTYPVTILNIDPCIPPSCCGTPYVNEYNSYIARTSYSKAAMGSCGGGPVGYGTVTVSFGENGANGKEKLTFKNDTYDGVIGGFPFPPVTSLGYKRGQQLTDTIMDASGNWLKAIVSTYKVVPNYMQTGYAVGFVIYNHCYEGVDGLLVPQRSVISYASFATLSEWVQKTSEQEDTRSRDGGIVSVKSNYYYDNPVGQQITRTVTSKSDGTSTLALTNYADNYPAGTPFIDSLKANNILSAPIEQVVYRVNGTDTTIVSGNLTQYKTTGRGLPDQLYKLESIAPLTLPQFKLSNKLSGMTSTNGAVTSFSPDSHFNSKLTYNNYDSSGNPLTLTPAGGIAVSYHWGYNNQYPIAECKNATNTEFYYEGFEESTASGVVNGIGHTGNKYSSNTAISWTLPNSRSYVITYWYKSAGVWKYRAEQAFTGTFTMTGSDIGAYDDIRIFPSGALMSTYTYDPLVGMTSATDTKGQTTYYEYDGFQRLVNIRDQDGKIIKHTDYHYQNQ